MEHCEYCESQHYEAFVHRELVNRALIDLSETGGLDDVVSVRD